MTDKEFNDTIEKLSRIWNKSFSETLRDLCSEAGIEFKLTLKTEEKKEVMKKILEKDVAKEIIPQDKMDEILRWINTRRGKKSST